jgi:hypothetical protein
MDDEENQFKSGRYLTRRAKEVLAVIAVAFGLLLIFTGGNPISIIGWKKTPGDLFEQRFYSGKYYVMVQRNRVRQKNINWLPI